MSKDLNARTWLDSQHAWSKEQIPREKLNWNLRTQKSLKKAFPPGERRFCEIINAFKNGLSRRAKILLWYHRQKAFNITAEIVFFGDFYFKALKLLVEIDGTGHGSENAKLHDEWRTKLIATHRISVVRFSDAEFEESDSVLVLRKFLNAVQNVPGHFRIKQTILKAAKKRLTFMA